MENYCFVRPEHLNHHGNLFGGKLLSWVDEYAWLAARKEFPGSMLVTRAMNDIDFKKSIPLGAILRFHMELKQKGTTSLQYHVDVFSTPVGEEQEELVFTTSITFVNIDEKGNKIPLKVPYSAPKI